MAQANAALLREDAPLLHRMLHSHDLPIEAADTRTELAHIRTLVLHLQQDLTTLDAEIEALTQSDMADLCRRTAAAAAEGSDILAELAARVKGQIGIAMSRYERERHRMQHPPKGPRTEDILTAATPPRQR
jgi:predicted RecB family endonuclease